MLLRWKNRTCWRFNGYSSESEVFTSVESVVALEGDIVSRDKISMVRKVSVNNVIYYVKIYWRNGNGARKYLGRGRLQGEWENLCFFSSLGINTPRIVAYGQTFKNGIFVHGVLVTEEVEFSQDLLTLTKDNPRLLHDRDWLKVVMQQVADYTRRLHDCGFVHWDLKWRNILVSYDYIKQPKVYFFDCPLGKKRVGWFSKRGAIKDIACLDKVAQKVLSRTSRLRFYLYYAKNCSLSGEHKRKINKIINFF